MPMRSALRLAGGAQAALAEQGAAPGEPVVRLRLHYEAADAALPVAPGKGVLTITVAGDVFLTP